MALQNFFDFFQLFAFRNTLSENNKNNNILSCYGNIFVGLSLSVGKCDLEVITSTIKCKVYALTNTENTYPLMQKE